MGECQKKHEKYQQPNLPHPGSERRRERGKDCGKKHISEAEFSLPEAHVQKIYSISCGIFLMVVGIHWWISRCGWIFLRLEASLWVFSGGKEGIFRYKGERTKEAGGRGLKCDRRAVSL